jgi:hypothetical protein
MSIRNLKSFARQPTFAAADGASSRARAFAPRKATEDRNEKDGRKRRSMLMKTLQCALACGIITTGCFSLAGARGWACTPLRRI